MQDVKLLLLHSNTWNHLTVYKRNELIPLKKCHQQNVLIKFTQPLCSGRIWHKVNF